MTLLLFIFCYLVSVLFQYISFFYLIVNLDYFYFSWECKRVICSILLFLVVLLTGDFSVLITAFNRYIYIYICTYIFNILTKSNYFWNQRIQVLFKPPHSERNFIEEFFFFCFAVLMIKPRALCVLDRCFITELYCQPSWYFAFKSSTKLSWASATHAWNLSYLGVWDQKEHFSRPAQRNSSQQPISKQPHQNSQEVLFKW